MRQYILEYTTNMRVIPLPRENDMVMVDMFISAGYTGEALGRLNRCRIARQMLFLSDIVTANGRQVERNYLAPVEGTINHSRYSFGREEPTTQDWVEWVAFWARETSPGFYLDQPLEAWVAPSHRRWEWFYNRADDIVEQITADGVAYYHPYTAGRRRTRGEQAYCLTYTQANTVPQGNPVSVQLGDEGIIIRGVFGPPLAVSPSQPDDFWLFLRSWGGEWMWDGVVDETQDLRWLIDGITNGTVIGVTDGSYDRKRLPLVSGAGWLLCCTSSKKMLKGNFFEHSSSASSYRGELLGLVALHTLLLALCTFYEIPAASGQVCCDNISALRQSSKRRRRVQTGASQADLLRVIRTIKYSQTLKLSYEHVDGHQDRHKTWRELRLVEQLNVVCDLLAKSGVDRSLATPLPRRGRQILPLEKAAVFANGHKLTTDVSKEVRYCMGEEEARAFYTAAKSKGGLGWSAERFNLVDFKSLDKTLASKPDMYGIWLSKQSAGVCATRYNMARLQDLVDNKCPNCGMVEKAEHLNVCPSEDRTKLLEEGVDKLSSWLIQDNKTDPELAYYLPKYILFRGCRPWSTLGVMSPGMRAVARAQDSIGWREFMEGKVAKEMGRLQQFHCATASCRMNGEDWMKHFIHHILHLSHSQWIFRNITLHHRTQGYLRLKERKDVLQQIDTLIETDPDTVPEASKFLLEFDHNALYRSSFEHQVYWVAAIKAATKAGRRVACMGASARRRAARRRATRPRYNFPSMVQQPNNEPRPSFIPVQRGNVNAIEAGLRSNKRYKPGD